MLKKLRNVLPAPVINRLEAYEEALSVASEMRDPRVMLAIGPSAVRGLLLQRGKQGGPTTTRAHHDVHFDWNYASDRGPMRELYTRAKEGQWNGDDLPWQTSVDPVSPEVRLLPERFIDAKRLHAYGIRLDQKEERELSASLAAWMLSQFLHGEQGALFAAAQVTEAVPSFDGKLYGSTQVVDEGRHVEVFHRYLDEKLGKLYQVNDNLFVIIDSLMSDSRWDMKFLGMQIMVEGLALGAFATLYKQTREPLLRELLKRVISDEARHVHYGVLTLRDHITKELDERERREREDWAFEVALLMRNRFMAFEVYEEWFEGRMTRAQWKDFVIAAPGMDEFRRVMFTRLVPNLRAIGLLTPRVAKRYAQVGLLQYMDGLAAHELSEATIMSDLDRAA